MFKNNPVSNIDQLLYSCDRKITKTVKSIKQEEQKYKRINFLRDNISDKNSNKKMWEDF